MKGKDGKRTKRRQTRRRRLKGDHHVSKLSKTKSFVVETITSTHNSRWLPTTAKKDRDVSKLSRLHETYSLLTRD